MPPVIGLEIPVRSNNPNHKQKGTHIKTMKKFIHKSRLIALAVGSLLIPTVGAQAEAFNFSNGDLILAFQATSGTGSTQNLFFNLGSTTDIRDSGGYIGSLGNLNTDLTTVFGADWFTRDDIWFGAFGNLNYQATSGIGSKAPVDGDPSRTVYVSRATTGINNSMAWTGYVSSGLGTASINFSGLEGNLTSLTATASGAAILDQTANPVEWNNSWTNWNPTPGAAFGIFSGGIQTSFGQSGSEVYLDIQRILATTTGANPTGPVGTGEWMTTVKISSNGDISLVPEPSSMALLGVAGLFALLRRRQKNKINQA